MIKRIGRLELGLSWTFGMPFIVRCPEGCVIVDMGPLLVSWGCCTNRTEDCETELEWLG